MGAGPVPRDGAGQWLTWLQPYLGVGSSNAAKRSAVAVTGTSFDTVAILLEDGSEVEVSGKALAAAGFTRLR